MALTTEGRVYSWGDGSDGKLGLGTRINAEKPKLIVSSSLPYISILVVIWNVCDVTKVELCTLFFYEKPQSLNKFYLCYFSQQGLPSVVIDICSGGSHSAAICNRGKLYTWGHGLYGRLGHGTNFTLLKPKQVVKRR